MYREDIMELCAEKALRDNSWETIEYLFRPSTVLELLLRISFEEMKKKFSEWVCDNPPGAMPHRFRGPYMPQIERAIKVEEFFRKLKDEQAKLS